ncbi:MAG TPA: hypothetical protein VMZ22_06605 [Acidimicrobiales bacterium]|nr:hypothetical protein [Acidimicrobiales bacterium]
MGITVSLLLFAAGAIMRYAVNVSADGFDLHTAGVILMVVGIVGAILSAINWASWGGFGGRTTTTVRETDVR